MAGLLYSITRDFDHMLMRRNENSIYLILCDSRWNMPSGRNFEPTKT